MKYGKCENCKKEFKDILTHKRYCDELYHFKNDVINMYETGISIKKISNKLKISKNRVIIFLDGKTRNKSESGKLAHKMYSENFKHSDESKRLMRKKRLEYMKNNPDKTAWGLSNMSYPEKLILDKFLELGYEKKYLIIREKSFFPYFIDFAFENEKIAFEIDGSQHLLPERKKSDYLKDNLLIKNGWNVIRVTDYNVKNNIDDIISLLENKLENNKIIEKINFGIINETKKYVNKEKDENGFTENQIKYSLRQRRVERPSLDILNIEIEKNGFEGVGRKYGVTGNSIRKWLKTYEKMKI